MTVDFVVVGQGIAGSVLSLSLIKAGYKVMVINNPQLSSCSSVAAGIWNPVVFKRLTKSWLADDLVPELLEFYHEAEQTLGVSLIYERAILKPFTEEQEKNLWTKKAEADNLFLDAHLYKDLHLSTEDTISDYSKVKHAGNLDVKLFLEKTQHYLEQNKSYLREGFEYSQLITEGKAIVYKQIRAKQIVFCEGHLISKNPFFDHVPLKPAKGEVLTIYCEGLLLDRDILNKGIFILPLSGNSYKVGATYNWEDLTDIPTDAAKQELIKKLETVIHVPFRVIEHEAGVRPAVIDRRPVAGVHPEFPTHYVFNGFGTKAVMLAPYFAKQFIDLIKNGTPLDQEVDVKRFFA
jgi:glycine oxidase